MALSIKTNKKSYRNKRRRKK